MAKDELTNKNSAGICCSLKTAQFFKADGDTTDPTWGGYTLYLWAVVELALIIIAACIPASRPLWDVFKRKSTTTKKTSSTQPLSAITWRRDITVTSQKQNVDAFNLPTISKVGYSAQADSGETSDTVALWGKQSEVV
jgi:hypothetical protein